jgi:SAM-dependent methyltransferase
MSDMPNVEQAAFWEEFAPDWLQGEQHSEKVAGLFGRRAMARLDLSSGQRVLDVGCGSGPTTVELAGRVVPGGEAVGADIAPTLVAAARQRATAAGVANASFVVADLQADDLGEAIFDAAFSRFGVMFFSDPERAFGRIRRAIRPGGQLVFSCWQDLFANEWMFVPGSAAIAVTGVLPPMPGPGEPGPFSLAEPGRVGELLDRAGFSEIAVDPVVDEVVLPEHDLGSLAALSAQVGPVHEALRNADDETRRQILEAVHEALEAKVSDGELRLSAAAYIVSAQA